jgi:hypothetical protein
MIRRALAIIALGAVVSGPATGTEPGRGFPFRGANAHCVPVDQASRHARGDFRWFAKTLARFYGREDGCRVVQMTRYGQAEAWRVRLACPGGTTYEDWMLNYDGSITANRDGWKATFRACERGLGR